MAIKLDPETEIALRKYAAGELTVTEFAGWLASAEYDNDLPEEERDELARVSLMVIEAMEKLRPADQILEAVQDLLALAQVDTAHRRSA